MFLLGNMLGNKTSAMVDSIFTKFLDDPSIGLIFPDDPNAIGWNLNFAIAKSIAIRLGIQTLPENFNFPVGTMFWARTSALAPLFNLKLDWDAYPDEPIAIDGTLLHTIERLIPFIVLQENFTIVTTNIVGLTR